MDNMVKVDPKLFVTCRLCLEAIGMFQITPVVQQQIKYCFDIDVDQYDGLPQLICSQCESILSEYFTKKRIFVGRQNALKAKIQVRKEVEDSLCPSPPHEAVSSSQQCDNEEPTIRRKSISKSRKRKARKISSSSSSTGNTRQDALTPENGSTSENEYQIQDSRNVQVKKRTKFRRQSWEENYTKGYVCKLCNKYLKFGGGYTNHFKIHANLFSKYEDVINRSCTVQLIKIDGKPNPTGNNDTVALSKDRIIGQHTDNTYLLYASKCDKAEYADDFKSEVSVVESDDAEEILGKGLQAKRRRLFSTSSTDTIVLNNDNATSEVDKRVVLNSQKGADEEIECINIDDSSNGSQQSDSLSVNDNSNAPVKPKDVETIKNLIKVCCTKYISKRQESFEIETKKAESKGPQLKHKLLSIGRKVINRQGLACTGLLRFMESKNLPVKWVPMISSNKEMNYVRITARLKGRNELTPDNLGWKKRHDVPEKEQPEILPKEDSHIPVIQMNPSSVNDSSKLNISSTPTTNGSNLAPRNEFIQTSQGVSLPQLNLATTCKINENTKKSPVLCKMLSVKVKDIRVDGNTLPANTLFQEYDTKLLNANPVANPKQLPKKFNLDTKLLTNSIIGTVSQNFSSTNESTDESLCIVVDQPADPELCMPIITSTTSLAGSSAHDSPMNVAQNENICDENPTSNLEIEKPAPRIKVKPFSELMSDRALKTLTHTQSATDNIWVPNIATTAATTGLNMMSVTRVTSGHVPIQPAPQPNSKTLVPIEPAPQPNTKTLTATPNTNQNYIILDTVELPNTKTKSPIQYFRNLLQVHNIILLESHAPISATADCLIKFKLQFFWDSVNKPVTLCLSVHCDENKFSLGVRDPNQLTTSVNLDQLSANWQWEILKIYTVREDVIEKMLQNAQKISQKMYEHTKSFLCLLKSINVKKDNV